MITCYTDGACRVSNPGLCSSSFIVYRDGQEVHRHSRALEGLNSNIVAEYNALLDALRWAAEHKESLDIRCDLQLVVRQVNCEWTVKHEALRAFVTEAFGLLHSTGSSLSWVRGHSGDAGNESVDRLCNETLDAVQGKVPVTRKTSKEN